MLNYALNFVDDLARPLLSFYENAEALAAAEHGNHEPGLLVA